MSGRGVIKALSNMSIDEVSLVDRGANQHALISFAKRAPQADEVFEKARGGGVTTMKANDDVDIETHSGDDPADVVDDYVMNDGGGFGPGKALKGAKKTSGKVVNGKSSPAGDSGPAKKAPAEEHGEDVDEVEKALSALGLYLEHEDDEVEKNFGAQSPFGQQQPQAPQFGNPPAMQSVGAMPMGQGAPQAPPGAGAPSMAMPGPQMPGMGGMPGMGQQPPMQLPQLPPEVIQYIQQLEQKAAAASKPEGSDSNPSDGSNGSSGSDNSDSSNKPFGKSEDYNMDTGAFLEELSKALRDEDQVEAVSKAFAAQQNAFQEELSKRDAHVAELTEFAKAERDLRLEREFIAKAAEFDVPVAPEELGPVLKRAAESLDMEDFSVIVKCLDAAGAGEALFGEFGKRGTADNADIFDMVDGAAEELTKNYDVTGAQAVTSVFEANPDLYDQFVANQRHNRF